MARPLTFPRLLASQGFLQLSSPQRAELVRLRGVCLGTLATVIEERNSIHAFLTVSGRPRFG